MSDPSQFHTDRTHSGRWTITFGDPPINMFVPTTNFGRYLPEFGPAAKETDP